MSDFDILPKDGDAYAELAQLEDAITGALIIDAQVSVTLYTLGGAPVAGATSLPAPFDPATNIYRVVIPRTISVSIGQKYECRATATKGGLAMPFSQIVKVERFAA